jgi:aminoglycoside phosphotransferase (APT) family kinase protein
VQPGFTQLVRRIDPTATLTAIHELTGGMSARITVLDLDRPSGPTRLVVRQYGEKNRLADPTPGSTEAGLLRHLRSFDFPAPEPVLADDGDELLGGPYAVVGYVEGDGPPAAWSAPLADHLVGVLGRLHRLPRAVPDGRPTRLRLPLYADRVRAWLGRSPATPDASMRETEIRTVLQDWWPHRHEAAQVILHGDFWPGNTVWRGGGLAGVIDWEDAALGDPRSDLANLRLEVLWAYGSEAAADVTERYAAEVPGVDLADQPYWDLVAATRPVGRLDEWGLDPQRWELYLTRFQDFVDTALARIGGVDGQPSTDGWSARRG